jgi:hypothetical protein
MRISLVFTLTMSCAFPLAGKAGAEVEENGAIICEVPLSKILLGHIFYKDWPGAQKTLGEIPAGEMRDAAVKDVILPTYGKYEEALASAPKETIAAFAKAVVEAIQRNREKSEPKDLVVLSSLYWKAEDKKAAGEWAREAVKLAGEKQSTPRYRDAVGRFAREVEAGKLPGMNAFRDWAFEKATE